MKMNKAIKELHNALIWIDADLDPQWLVPPTTAKAMESYPPWIEWKKGKGSEEVELHGDSVRIKLAHDQLFEEHLERLFPETFNPLDQPGEAPAAPSAADEAEEIIVRKLKRMVEEAEHSDPGNIGWSAKRLGDDLEAAMAVRKGTASVRQQFLVAMVTLTHSEWGDYKDMIAEEYDHLYSWAYAYGGKPMKSLMDSAPDAHACPRSFSNWCDSL